MSQSPARAENLWQVYELARANDPIYRAAEADYRAQLETKAQAIAPLLPQVNASASRGKDKLDVTKSTTFPPIGNYDTNTTKYSLSLTQAIYHHDRWVALRQANAQVARAEAGWASAKHDLIIRVAQAYFGVLSADDSLNFARAEKQAFDQQLQQTQQRFQVGLSAITDVYDAQARYDQSVAQEITADNQLATAREALRELTGQAVMNLALLKDPSPLLNPEPANIDSWVKTALEQNFTLLMSEKTLDIARDEVNRVRAGHYPTLDLVAARTSTNTSGDSTLDSKDTTLSLQLNVPLFSGGLVYSQTNAAEQRYFQNKELYEQQRRATERAARISFLSVQADVSQVTALRQTLKSSQTAMEATQTGYEVGTRTIVDVLNSKQSLYGAQRDYAVARYNYIIETLKLKQAVGSLNDDEVKKVNEWLQ
ncbi:MAG: TolC family outer membrane protein [Gammaproteobacteria bacterium]|nr:TolC family outer membrane protein [Gammaproteobacteria bacterium]